MQFLSFYMSLAAAASIAIFGSNSYYVSQSYQVNDCIEQVASTANMESAKFGPSPVLVKIITK
jgi:hypothetical protein